MGWIISHGYKIMMNEIFAVAMSLDKNISTQINKTTYLVKVVKEIR